MIKLTLNNELITLHLKVLKDLVNGLKFHEIQEKYARDFDKIDYLKHAIPRLLSFNNEKLIGAYPISPIPTNYKINITNIGIGYAMCAIDALGVAYTFMEVTKIITKFQDTNEVLIIEIDPIRDTIMVNDSNEFFVTYKPPNTVDNIALEQCPAINFYKNKHNISEELTIVDSEQALLMAKQQFTQEAILNCILGTQNSSCNSSCNC